MTGGQYPEWIVDDVQTLRDCERYGCLPSELDEEDWHILTRHRAIESAEAWYLRKEAKSLRKRK